MPQIELLLKSGDGLAASGSVADEASNVLVCTGAICRVPVLHTVVPVPSISVMSGQCQTARRVQCYLTSTDEATEAS